MRNHGRKAPSSTSSFQKDIFSWYNNTLNDGQCYMNRSKFNLIVDWFDTCIRDARENDNRILLLSGPTGSGKTFCINFIARQKGIILNDALNHHTQVKRKYRCLTMEQESATDDNQGSTRFIDLYDNFCFSLSNSKIINQILQSENPVVIIVTNPVTLEPSINVWLRDLITCRRVCHIEILSFPRTVMEKAMKDVFGIKLENAVAVSNGDIRLALHIASMKFCLGEISFNPEFFSLVPQLTLFHRIGKIVYPRKRDDGPDFSDFFDDNPEIFNLYLHQNCYQHISDLESLKTVSDSFSLYDFLLRHSQILTNENIIYHSIPSRSVSISVNSIESKTRPKEKLFCPMSKPDYFAVYDRIRNKKRLH